ncbi:MAG: dockerin type I domain-containing protein, partial [Candidatus Omnitrophota bacterium]
AGIAGGNNVYSREDVVKAIAALENLGVANGRLTIGTHQESGFGGIADTAWEPLKGDWNQTESVYTVKASSTADADYDGLANWKDADSDNDGFSDGEETAKGTNKFNRESYPKIAITDLDNDGVSDTSERDINYFINNLKSLAAGQSALVAAIDSLTSQGGLTKDQFITALTQKLSTQEATLALASALIGKSVTGTYTTTADLKAALKGLASDDAALAGVIEGINAGTYTTTAAFLGAFKTAVFGPSVSVTTAHIKKYLESSIDIDKDGIYDRQDADSDNDGFSDGEETAKGTSAFDATKHPQVSTSDTDGDGILDVDERSAKNMANALLTIAAGQTDLATAIKSVADQPGLTKDQFITALIQKLATLETTPTLVNVLMGRNVKASDYTTAAALKAALISIAGNDTALVGVIEGVNAATYSTTSLFMSAFKAAMVGPSSAVLKTRLQGYSIDVDADGLYDWQDADSDNDGFSDGEEAVMKTKSFDKNDRPVALTTDTDSDGVSDFNEIAAGTKIDQADSDYDGFSDGEEALKMTDPLKKESAPSPSANDADGDGIANDVEQPLAMTFNKNVKDAATITLSADIRFNSYQGGGAGIILRSYTTSASYYDVFLNRDSQLVELRVVNNGKAAIIASYELGEENLLGTGTWYNVTVKAEGSTLTVYLDGEKIMTTVDDTYKAGTIGLFATANADVSFDNVALDTMTDVRDVAGQRILTADLDGNGAVDGDDYYLLGAVERFTALLTDKELISDMGKSDFNGDGRIDRGDKAFFNVNQDGSGTADDADILAVKKAVGLEDRIRQRDSLDLNKDTLITAKDLNLAKDGLEHMVDLTGDGKFNRDDLFIVDAVLNLDKGFNVAWEKFSDINKDGFIDDKDMNDLAWAITNYASADVDGNGLKDALDRQQLDKMIVDLARPHIAEELEAMITYEQIKKADLDGTGIVTANDVAEVRRWVEFLENVRLNAPGDEAEALAMIGVGSDGYNRCDINKNGIVNNADIVEAEYVYAKVQQGKFLSKEEFERFDFNNDNAITAADSTALELTLLLYSRGNVNGKDGVDSGDIDAIHQVIDMRSNGITSDLIKKADVNEDHAVNEKDKELISNALIVAGMADLDKDGSVSAAEQASVLLLIEDYIKGYVIDLDEIQASDANLDGWLNALDAEYYKDAIAALERQNAELLSWIESAPEAFAEAKASVIDVDGDGKITSAVDGTDGIKSDVERMQEIVTKYTDAMELESITDQMLKDADYNQDGRVDSEDMKILGLHLDQGSIALLDMNGDGLITEADRSEFREVQLAIDTDKIPDFETFKKFDFNEDGSLDMEDVKIIQSITEGYVDIDGDFVYNDKSAEDGGPNDGMTDSSVFGSLMQMNQCVNNMNALTNASDPLHVLGVVLSDELWVNKSKGINRFKVADMDEDGIIDGEDAQAFKDALDIRGNAYYDLDANGIFNRQDYLLLEEITEGIASYYVYEEASKLDESVVPVGRTLLAPKDYDIRDVNNDMVIDTDDVADIQEARSKLTSFSKDGLIRFVDDLLIEKLRGLNVSISLADVTRANFTTVNDAGGKTTIGEMVWKKGREENPAPPTNMEEAMQMQRVIKMPKGEEGIKHDLKVVPAKGEVTNEKGYLNIFGEISEYIQPSDINGDGLVNSEDLFLIQRAIREINVGENVSLIRKALGDINRDGRISLTDMDTMKRVVQYATDVNGDGIINLVDKDGLVEIQERIMRAKELKLKINLTDTLLASDIAAFGQGFDLKDEDIVDVDPVKAENDILFLEALANYLGLVKGDDTVSGGYRQKLNAIIRVLDNVIFSEENDNIDPELNAELLKTFVEELGIEPVARPSFTGFDNLDTEALGDDLASLFSQARLDTDQNGEVDKREVLEGLYGIFNFDGMDADGDGEIDQSEMDAMKKTMSTILETSSITSSELERADISGDGIVNAFDYELLYKAVNSSIDVYGDKRIDNQDYRAWLMLYDYFGYRVRQPEDLNTNGILDPGEDLNGNGELDWTIDELSQADFNKNTYIEAGWYINKLASTYSTEYFFDANHNMTFDEGESFFDADGNGLFGGDTSNPAGYVFGEYTTGAVNYPEMRSDKTAWEDIRDEVEGQGQFDLLDYDQDGLFTLTDAEALADLIEFITKGTTVADLEKVADADLGIDVDLTLMAAGGYMVIGKDGVVNAGDVAQFEKIYGMAGYTWSDSGFVYDSSKNVLDIDGSGYINATRDPDRILEVAEFERLETKFTKWNDQFGSTIDQYEQKFVIKMTSQGSVIKVGDRRYLVSYNALENRYIFRSFYTFGTYLTSGDIKQKLLTLVAGDATTQAYITESITEDKTREDYVDALLNDASARGVKGPVAALLEKAGIAKPDIYSDPTTGSVTLIDAD